MRRYVALAFLALLAGCSSPGYTRDQLRWPWPDDRKLVASNLLTERELEDIPYLPPGRKLETESHPLEALARFKGYDENLKLPSFQPAGKHDILVWYLTKQQPFAGPNAEMIQIYSFPHDILLQSQYDPFPADKIGWTVYHKEPDGTWKWVDREELRKQQDTSKGPIEFIREFFRRRSETFSSDNTEEEGRDNGPAAMGILVEATN